MRYQVTDINKALVNNKDFEKQLSVLMQLALRAILGSLILDELWSKKDTIASAISENSISKITDLGLAVSDTGIRDVNLPGDMKEIMNQVLIAEKKSTSQQHYETIRNRFEQKLVEHRQIDGRKRNVVEIEGNGICRKNCR